MPASVNGYGDIGVGEYSIGDNMVSIVSVSGKKFLYKRVSGGVVVCEKIIAGFTELIPYLGPTLGAIPAVLLAFLQEPFKAVIVILIYIAIQQFENVILVPQVMKKAVGVNPIISIVALIAGFQIGAAVGIGSILGAILAIPLVVTFSIIINSSVNKD